MPGHKAKYCNPMFLLHNRFRLLSNVSLDCNVNHVHQSGRRTFTSPLKEHISTTNLTTGTAKSQLNDVNVLDLDEIKNHIDNATFWSLYEKIKSPGDGHCFLHSVAKILNMNSQSANNQITINDLCEKLIRETIIKSANDVY